MIAIWAILIFGGLIFGSIALCTEHAIYAERHLKAIQGQWDATWLERIHEDHE